MNIVAFFHARKFTHFSDKEVAKTQSPEKLPTDEKIKALLLGVNNPRPLNAVMPRQQYKTVKLMSNKKIECWYIHSGSSIKTGSPGGTVILFHGYGGSKSSLLDKSDEFLKLGFNTMLVDFMGSGGSEGNETTIGFKEALEVKTCFDYLKRNGEKNIYMFGTSLGAAAILKALHDYNINPAGVILECPFGSMYQTVCARFRNMHAPTFPMAGLLVFWGGIQHGYWAFSHNPTEYAKKVHCSVLLLYGEKDRNVSRKETDDIFANLGGPKTLKTYELAGHENYLKKYKAEWISDVSRFLNTCDLNSFPEK